MNSNNAVEQGAGVILCSAERAEALGVPRDRWVFPHSGTDAHDHYFVSNRYDLGSSPAMRLAGRAALDLAGCGLDDLAPISTEERRVGKECVSTCQSQWSAYH